MWRRQPVRATHIGLALAISSPLFRFSTVAIYPNHYPWINFFGQVCWAIAVVTAAVGLLAEAHTKAQ